VLRLLALLARSPEGVRAGAAAKEIGRSLSATYELLDALCAEGFALHTERGAYRLADPANAAIAAQGGRPAPLVTFDGVLDEVFARTHKRTYLAVSRQGRLLVPLERGRQGIRRVPGIESALRGNAHALALGKVALSLLERRAAERYVATSLTRFTDHTIVQPAVLLAELDDIRRTGIAMDREEFEDDFCCLAVPLFTRRRQPFAVLGISMSRHAFDEERDGLAVVLREVAERAGRDLAAAPVPALPEEREVS